MTKKSPKIPTPHPGSSNRDYWQSFVRKLYSCRGKFVVFVIERKKSQESTFYFIPTLFIRGWSRYFKWGGGGGGGSEDPYIWPISRPLKGLGSF